MLRLGAGQICVVRDVVWGGLAAAAVGSSLGQVVTWDMLPAQRMPLPSDLMLQNRLLRANQKKANMYYCPCLQVCIRAPPQAIWCNRGLFRALRRSRAGLAQVTRRFTIPRAGHVQGPAHGCYGLNSA